MTKSEQYSQVLILVTHGIIATRVSPIVKNGGEAPVATVADTKWKFNEVGDLLEHGQSVIGRPKEVIGPVVPVLSGTPRLRNVVPAPVWIRLVGEHIKDSIGNTIEQLPSLCIGVVHGWHHPVMVEEIGRVDEVGVVNEVSLVSDLVALCALLSKLIKEVLNVLASLLEGCVEALAPGLESLGHDGESAC